MLEIFKKKPQLNTKLIVIGCGNCGSSEVIQDNPSYILKSVICRKCKKMYIDVEFDLFHNVLGKYLGKIK